MAEAKSPPGLPVTVITYVPGVAVPVTVNEVALNDPVPVMVHAPPVIMLAGVLVIVHEVSDGLKPLPEIVTIVVGVVGP